MRQLPKSAVLLGLAAFTLAGSVTINAVHTGAQADRVAALRQVEQQIVAAQDATAAARAAAAAARELASEYRDRISEQSAAFGDETGFIE